MFKKFLYSLLTKIGVALINFAVLLVSSRYLGVSSRGEISIFILNITIIQIINEVYTGYSILHFVPKYNFKKLFGIGLIYSFIFCSLSNVIVVLLNKQLAGFEWIAYIISLLIILNTFNCVLILGKENLRVYNLLSFFQPFILLGGIFIFISVFKIYTVEAFIYPLLISFSLAFIGSSAMVSKYFFQTGVIKEFKIKPILFSGLLYQLASLLFVFSNRYSYYVLPDSASVGLYSSASSLMESLLIVVYGISPVLLSRMANQTKASDNSEMALTLGKASLCLSILLVMLLFFIPNEVFVFVLGKGFMGIKNLMLFYSPAVILAGFFIALSNYFIASGNQKIPVLCYSIGFSSSIFLAPLLIDSYGVQGAALNANISYLLMCTAMCLSFMRISKISLQRFFSFRADLKNLQSLLFPVNKAKLTI